MGTFEAWCSVVGGILQAAGIGGFLANREELYRSVDAESEEWRAFVAAWWDEHGAAAVQVADLMPLVRDRDLIPSVFASARDDAGERALKTRLGRALSQRRDRSFGRFRIVSLGRDAHFKVALYRLEEGSGDDPTVRTPAGPAEVTHDTAPVSDSDAGVAGPAGPHFDTEEELRTRSPVELTTPLASPSPPIADQVPQVPQVPRPDSEHPPSAAGPATAATGQVPHEVSRQLDAPERVLCPGGCAVLVPPGQMCSACAAAAVDEWKARRDRSRPQERPTPRRRNT